MLIVGLYGGELCGGMGFGVVYRMCVLIDVVCVGKFFVLVSVVVVGLRMVIEVGVVVKKFVCFMKLVIDRLLVKCVWWLVGRM